jgi:predicted regulator of Ras-like GTPase activity (Roadblock/LC7/MglB family)
VASNGAALMVPLSDLTETWPEALRHEITLLNLSKAVVALPMEVVEAGLKQGRVACSWKQLRAWVKPAPATPTISVHDSALLSLPLKVIAPLFLAKQQAAKAQRRVSVDESIPNLFFGSSQPDAASVLPPAQPAVAPPAATSGPPRPKPADTNYYVWKDDADAPIEPEPVFKRGSASPGTEFLKRYATPNEIVSRAAALDGVAGALISLPDGLLVASHIPSELNADTVAAFLPQIFGRVSQCTKELRMGDLNNLNFTVGNVPWKIFRVGSIFFAAFGRTGEPLPTGHLAGLAAELDRKPR